MNYKLFLLSVPCALLSIICEASAAIKITNKSRSYADAYNQVNELRASVAAPTLSSAHSDDLGIVGQTENSDSSIDLPIRVANKSLAADIVSGESTDVTYGQLERCTAIYPNGEFAWDTPTAGLYSGGADMCTSVVEMRGYQMGPNGSDLVLARVNVAAGDAIRCNISDWPSHSHLPAAGTITFPYDNEPTVEDVIAQMNQEQKQHAGLKIAAGTLIAAVAGNALGAPEVGSNAILGTNTEKLVSTAIGGLGGAAIMAGNVYGGKVAGDMILSAGINAAAGSVIGNMSGIGESVLRTENCQTSGEAKTCDLWGVLVKTGTKDTGHDFFYNIKDGAIHKCVINTDSVTNTDKPYKDCAIADVRLKDIILQGYCLHNSTTIKEFNNSCTVRTYGALNKPYDLDSIKSNDFLETTEYFTFGTKYNTSETDRTTLKSSTSDTDADRLIKIVKATIVMETIPVVYQGYTGKHKKSDWNTFGDFDAANVKKRMADGSYAELTGEEKKNISGSDNGQIKREHFEPLTQDADDGALIDFNNKARTTSTAVGAGVGGALGAFTAYQGAQTEIQERWVAAVREYKDSLQKVYCATGNRFLTYYNDVVLIPNMTE